MEIVPLATADAAAVVAADAIEDLVRSRPDAVLGLATGSSPLPRTGAGPTAPRRCGPVVRLGPVFLLDEYVGLPPGHPQSYRATILVR